MGLCYILCLELIFQTTMLNINVKLFVNTLTMKVLKIIFFFLGGVLDFVFLNKAFDKSDDQLYPRKKADSLPPTAGKVGVQRPPGALSSWPAVCRDQRAVLAQSGGSHVQLGQLAGRRGG